ncbi:MAG: Rpn family recombination-promoting nuclease/putative transposase [Chloroflexi bacterium]|nr:MAG: Rpn family recombination-promoting nuclease/putative transposase [Chloroflexota bacterium]
MMISNPHDRYFREIFSDPVVAQDLLRNYLPAAVVESLDLTTLVLQKESFIDEDLRQHFTDLLYTVQQKNGAPAHVYILFEHKSYPDRLTSFQLLRYLVRIWERMLRQGEPLTPIIPLVFYHGVTEWNAPRSFADLLPAAEGLAAYAPHFHYELLDLSAIPEQQIKGEVLLRAVLLAFRSVLRPHVGVRLLDIVRLLSELTPERSALQYIETLLRYLVAAPSDLTMAQIRTVLETVGKEKRTMLISPAAQEWLEQGREEGVERGLEQGKRQLLLDLITYRFGAPEPALRAALDACNREQLSAVSHIVLDASSAAEVLRNIRRMALADV